jgi:SAM-dependent methyltransferase
MKRIFKKIRNKWHKDLKDILEDQNKGQEEKYYVMLGNQNKIIQDLNEMLGKQNKIIQDLQEVNANLYVNQAWLLFQRHNIDYVVKNKTWHAQYSAYDEFQSDKTIKEFLYNHFSLMGNNTPPYIKAYCVVCNKFNIMSSHSEDYINASESYFCCGMNSRMRAMYEYVIEHFPDNKKVYIQEAVTPAYYAYEKCFGSENIVGSEYLGQDKICGEYYEHDGHRIMHQDCTKLSFDDNTFDLLISQQVFEHVFDTRKALAESLRVLGNNGSCIISIPFFYTYEKSVMLAKLEGEKITQIIDPPEIHGNPISGTGSLAFWHHGWEFIEIMKDVGYRDVRVHFFNNLYRGYFGVCAIITGKK